MLAPPADDIERNGGKPVGLESWPSTAQPGQLRPAVDRLPARVRGSQDEPVVPHQ
jgi:hypothetical protein